MLEIVLNNVLNIILSEYFLESFPGLLNPLQSRLQMCLKLFGSFISMLLFHLLLLLYILAF